MKKRNLLGILSVVMSLLVLCSGNIYASSVPFDEPIEYDPAFTAKQIELNKLSNRIVVNVFGDTIFYNLYGGSYIDENNSLVLCVTELNDDLSKALGSYLSDDIRIKIVQHSLEYLIDLKEKVLDACIISSKSRGGYSILSSLRSITILETTNNIEIDLEMTDKTVISEKTTDEFIKEVFSNEFSVANSKTSDYPFVIKSGKHEFLASPGDFLITPSAGGGSVGFPCRRKVGYNQYTSYELGFVSAGHSFNTGERVYNISGSQIGTCTSSKVGGSVDVAFIEMTDANALPNTLSFNGVSHKITSEIVVSEPSLGGLIPGTVVYKIGCATGTTKGNVVSKNTTAIVNDHGVSVTVTNLFLATFNADSGDSGGLVFIPETADNGEKVAYAQGIISTKNMWSGDCTYTPASSIYSDSDLTIEPIY